MPGHRRSRGRIVDRHKRKSERLRLVVARECTQTRRQGRFVGRRQEQWKENQVRQLTLDRGNRFVARRSDHDLVSGELSRQTCEGLAVRLIRIDCKDERHSTTPECQMVALPGGLNRRKGLTRQRRAAVGHTCAGHRDVASAQDRGQCPLIVPISRDLYDPARPVAAHLRIRCTISRQPGALSERRISILSSAPG
jgi:hypothetical protein